MYFQKKYEEMVVVMLVCAIPKTYYALNCTKVNKTLWKSNLRSEKNILKFILKTRLHCTHKKRIILWTKRIVECYKLLRWSFEFKFDSLNTVAKLQTLERILKASRSSVVKSAEICFFQLFSCIEHQNECLSLFNKTAYLQKLHQPPDISSYPPNFVWNVTIAPEDFAGLRGLSHPWPSFLNWLAEAASVS